MGKQTNNGRIIPLIWINNLKNSGDRIMHLKE